MVSKHNRHDRRTQLPHKTKRADLKRLSLLKRLRRMNCLRLSIAWSILPLMNCLRLQTEGRLLLGGLSQNTKKGL